MPLIPLHGHAALRARFDDAIRRNALPGSLLLHGPLGVGKQRLALWLGQRLLCESPEARPCGQCQHCRYAVAGTHPDIHWYFPRPTLGSGVTAAKVNDDFREAVGERVKTGAYPPAPPGEGIYLPVIQAMVQSASMAPALGARKVYVVGEAERMVLREGAEEAAGAFLKLLEEPPARATIVLTTAEPGSLIPTIRSRLVSIRVATLAPADVDAVLAEPAMQAAVMEAGGPKSAADQRRVANGAPGVLLAEAEWAAAVAQARQMLDAASNRDRRAQIKTAMMLKGFGARKEFATSLDALTTLLHERVRASTDRGNTRDAVSSAQALDRVEAAKERATGNVNPQLITTVLLRELEGLLT